MASSSRQAGPRVHRSRRDRPCDACRSRKIACRIVSSPPCVFCASRSSNCTFQQAPGSKKRKLLTSEIVPEGEVEHLDDFSLPYLWDELLSEDFDSTIFSTQNPIDDSNSYPTLRPKNGQTNTTRSPPQDVVQSEQAKRSSPAINDRPVVDMSRLHHYQVYPETSHLNRDLVRLLLDQSTPLLLPQVNIEQVSCSHEQFKAPLLVAQTRPTFLTNSTASTEPLTCQSLESLVSAKQGKELIKLYFHFVQPAFPILDRCHSADSNCQDVSMSTNLSMSLLACIYATAIPFAIHNDYLTATLTEASHKRDQLYAIALTSFHNEINAPSLENLQCCLLLLQKGPTGLQLGLAPTYSYISSVAVKIANILGLQYDCTTWELPTEEKHLRQKLWWATLIVDFWTSVDSPGGRSISSNGYDVLPPTTDLNPVTTTPKTADQGVFLSLVHLTELAACVNETYYTVRAIKTTSADLFKALELAKPLRTALSECQQRLRAIAPLGTSNGRIAAGSVHLSAAVVAVMLFRALLRPIKAHRVDHNGAEDGSATAIAAIVTGSINCAREAVELLEILVATIGYWNDFWHSWSQGNFAIISTFLVQLVLTQDIDDTSKAEIMGLVARWKHAVRIGAGSGGWASSLMTMALSRMDAMLSHANPSRN